MGTILAVLPHNETVCEWIAIIYENRIEAHRARPTRDGWDNSRPAGYFGIGLDATLENRTNNGFVPELVSDFELALLGRGQASIA